jgi:transposase-like protein
MSEMEARRLRVEEGLSVAQIQQRLGVTKYLLSGWLRGVPAPEWTRRPNAKDDLRARAVQLRLEGWSVNDIALELGVARSTGWEWTKHLAQDPDSGREHRKRAGHRAGRSALRAQRQAAGATEVGELDQRDLLLAAAVAYWCAGTRAEPGRSDAAYVSFVHSDARLLALFLRFLESVGIPRDRLHFRVSIHESGDARAAVSWWCGRLGLPADRFQRATVNRHGPRTDRHDVGPDSHGCLVIRVPRSRELYWKIEGVINGLEPLPDVPLG